MDDSNSAPEKTSPPPTSAAPEVIKPVGPATDSPTTNSTVAPVPEGTVPPVISPQMLIPFFKERAATNHDAGALPPVHFVPVPAPQWPSSSATYTKGGQP
jgi:hypothetical protein